MVVISHFKLYPALFPLKWLICIPNISAVRGNVVFETLHDFYRTAIFFYITRDDTTELMVILNLFNVVQFAHARQSSSKLDYALA